MRPSSAALKAAVLVATMLATPTSGKTVQPFHSSVNLSVTPGKADLSNVPLATQKAENEQRVAEADYIGFDFVDCV
jgi:hypothetical protein